MSRVKFEGVVDNTEEFEDDTLDILVPRYAENKNELDSYKKICDTENNKIKDLMLEQGISTYSTGGYKVTRSVSVKETFNEDQLMNYINTVLWNVAENGSITCPYIKTQYVVDYDALEKAIYNGEITAEQVLAMDKFKETKETVTLRLTKEKKAK